MKNLLSIGLIILSFSVYAQPKYLSIKAKVYQINERNIADTPLVDLLNKANLIYEPSILTYPGKEASVEIVGESELMRMEVNSNEEELTYTINFSTKEKQDGGWLTMSYESPVKDIGSPSLIKSSLWQQHMIILVESKLVDEPKLN